MSTGILSWESGTDAKLLSIAISNTDTVCCKNAVVPGRGMWWWDYGKPTRASIASTMKTNLFCETETRKGIVTIDVRMPDGLVRRNANRHATETTVSVVPTAVPDTAVSKSIPKYRRKRQHHASHRVCSIPFRFEQSVEGTYRCVDEFVGLVRGSIVFVLDNDGPPLSRPTVLARTAQIVSVQQGFVADAVLRKSRIYVGKKERQAHKKCSWSGRPATAVLYRSSWRV